MHTVLMCVSDQQMNTFGDNIVENVYARIILEEKEGVSRCIFKAEVLDTQCKAVLIAANAEKQT